MKNQGRHEPVCKYYGKPLKADHNCDKAPDQRGAFEKAIEASLGIAKKKL